MGPRAPRKRTIALTKLTQVPDHSILVVRSAVVLAERVEDASRANQALGKVPKYMHADAVSALRFTRAAATGEPSVAKREAEKRPPVALAYTRNPVKWETPPCFPYHTLTTHPAQGATGA